MKIFPFYLSLINVIDFFLQLCFFLIGDNELIESLLFDLSVTRGATSSWMQELDRQGQTNADTSRQ